MSLVFIDGFDDGQTATKWTTSQGSSVAGRNGNGTQLLNAVGNASYSGPQSMKKNFPTTHADLYVGFAYTTSGIGGGLRGGMPVNVNFYTDGGATAHAGLLLSPTGVLEVHMGVDSGALLASAPAYVLVTNRWYYIECYCKVADSGGRFTVRLDGTTIIDFTGDTRNGGTSTNIDAILISGTPGTQTGGASIVDDLWVADSLGTVNNTFLGDCAVETIYPNGDGTSSQWVGSDGNSVNNSLLVDEPGAPVTTDYVQSDVVDNKDLYAFQDLTRTAGSIKGVQVSAYTSKSDAGSRSLGLVASSGGSEAQSADVPLSTSYGAVTMLVENEPSTSAAWTIAQVNAAQFGVKVRP